LKILYIHGIYVPAASAVGACRGVSCTTGYPVLGYHVTGRLSHTLPPLCHIYNETIDVSKFHLLYTVRPCKVFSGAGFENLARSNPICYD